MALIRPRLTDFYDLALTQQDADFAVPFLDEDIPFCLDPFLLFKSPSMQDNSLHAALVNSFNHLGYLFKKGNEQKAVQVVIRASECDEVGLGFSASRHGHRIGKKVAYEILNLFKIIPQLRDAGFLHFEEVQLLVDGISKDRISDIACTLLKSWLIDYTMDQCQKLGIPVTDLQIDNVYDLKSNDLVDREEVKLPVNPESNQPVLLVPKRWLRRAPWISCDDYVQDYFPKQVQVEHVDDLTRIEILNFNRHNFDVVQVYVRQKERAAGDCRNDPLFQPIPVHSARRKLTAIRRLPTGKADNADRKYEDLVCQLLASLLYPHLDFADQQVRTDSGVQIRDLIFYNSRSMDFLQDIHQRYETRQLVFEVKNVGRIESNHINQLNRYLSNEFGSFGVLVTRHRLPRAMYRNTVDLWSGQRKCIIALTDEDLEVMVNVFETKQRLPIEVLKRSYVQFTRACPA